jgi:hypothetical protein
MPRKYTPVMIGLPQRCRSSELSGSNSETTEMRTFELSFMSDYAFFEYKAKLTNISHAEDEGEAVHCMIKMKNVDLNGKCIHEIELHQKAGDNVLFVINPKPHQKLSHSKIWNVTEEDLLKAGKASDYHRVGDCEIYFYHT